MASAAKAIINKVVTSVGAYPGETMIVGTGATLATTYGVISVDEGEFDFELLDEIGYGEYEVPKIWRTPTINNDKRIRLADAKKPIAHWQLRVSSGKERATRDKYRALQESRYWFVSRNFMEDVRLNNNPYYHYTRMYGDEGTYSIPSIVSRDLTVEQLNQKVYDWCKKSLAEPATDKHNLLTTAKWCSDGHTLYGWKMQVNGKRLQLIKPGDKFKDNDYDDLMDDPLLPYEDARWLEGVINEKSDLSNRRNVIHTWCTLKGKYTFWRDRGSNDFDLVWRYCYEGYDRSREPGPGSKDSYQKVIEKMVGASMDNVLGKSPYQNRS